MAAAAGLVSPGLERAVCCTILCIACEPALLTIHSNKLLRSHTVRSVDYTTAE